MERQLRALVEHSAETLHNFFHGFLTLDKLKGEVKPIRTVRPARTLYAVNEADVPELTPAQRIVQDHKFKDPAFTARVQASKRKRQLMRSKRLNIPIEKVAEAMDRELHDKLPPLQMPEFYDYQDFVNPIFRIELELKTKDKAQGSKMLQFSLNDEDIVDSFEKLFERTVDSLNGMLKPQHARVVDLTPQDHKREFDEIKRMRQLVRAQGSNKATEATHTTQSLEGTGEISTRKENAIEAMIGQMKNKSKSGAAVQDFDALLYPD